MACSVPLKYSIQYAQLVDHEQGRTMCCRAQEATQM